MTLLLAHKNDKHNETSHIFYYVCHKLTCKYHSHTILMHLIQLHSEYS